MTPPREEAERRAAWDLYASAALEAQLPSDGQPPVATDAVVCADAMLAERDKRFPPEPQPLGTLTWDAQAEWTKGYESGRRDERERIAKLAEEWAGGSYAHTEYQFRRFAAALREGAP